MRAGRFARAVEFLGEGAVEDVVDEGTFAGAGDAGDHRHDADGEFDGKVFEVVAARAFDGDPFAGDRTRDEALQGGDFAGEIAAGERGRRVHDDVGRTLCDDLAAKTAGAGAEFEDVVGAG